jgi:hypothetical protein
VRTLGSVIKAKSVERFLKSPAEARCIVDPNRQGELDRALRQFNEAYTELPSTKTLKSLKACVNAIRSKKGPLAAGSVEFAFAMALLKFHHHRVDMLPALTGLVVDSSVGFRDTTCLYVQRGDAAPEQFSLKKCAAAAMADEHRECEGSDVTTTAPSGTVTTATPAVTASSPTVTTTAPTATSTASTVTTSVAQETDDVTQTLAPSSFATPPTSAKLTLPLPSVLALDDDAAVRSDLQQEVHMVEQARQRIAALLAAKDMEMASVPSQEGNHYGEVATWRVRFEHSELSEDQ